MRRITYLLNLLALTSLSLMLSSESLADTWDVKDTTYLPGYVADDGSVDDGTEAEDPSETNVLTKLELLDLVWGNENKDKEITKVEEVKKSEAEDIAKRKTPQISGFPAKAYQQALAYLRKYPNSFSNERYLTIVDFTKPSHKKRLFIINLKTGGVEARYTTHGKGSDRQNSGRATKFGNPTPGAEAHVSSLGFYRTLGTYFGKNGLSLRLQGLSKTNSNAFGRAIVFHKAKYVSEKQGRAGRSHGCFAMDSSVFVAAIQKIKGGSLVYAWNGQ